MAERLFVRVISLSVRASFLILAVLLIRAIVKRKSNRAAYLLWGLVAVRLLLPVEVPVFFSGESAPGRLAESVQAIAEWAEPFSGREDVESIGQVSEEKLTQNTTDEKTSQVRAAEEKAQNRGEESSTEKSALGNVFFAASVVWVAGVIVLLAFGGISYERLRRVTDAGVEDGGLVWCDRIPSPFVMGIVKPRICVPFHMEREHLELALKHERIHIRRRDNLWRLLFALIVVFYWFNPFVWAAFFLFDRDCELSCDDEVVAELTAAERKQYFLAVLAASQYPTEKAWYLSAFSKGSIKGRLRNILQPKRSRRLLSSVCLCFGATAAVVTMVSAKASFVSREAETLRAPDTLVCASTCVAELRSDGTVVIHQVPELEDKAVCAINTAAAGQWENIVSLRGTFNDLYGVDTEGRLHISSHRDEYVQEHVKNHTTSENVNIAQIIQDAPAITRYLEETALTDGTVYENGRDPRVFLTKEGDLVTVEQDGPEYRFVTIAKQVAAYDGEYYLRSDGSLGAMNEKGSQTWDFRMMTESGKKFCALAVAREGLFGLCDDGSVVTYASAYYSAGTGDWKDVTSIRCSGALVMALHKDGHVSAALAWGKTSEALKEITGWKNIVAIATNGVIAAGKAADGTVYTVVLKED